MTKLLILVALKAEKVYHRARRKLSLGNFLKLVYFYLTHLDPLPK